MDNFKFPSDWEQSLDSTFLHRNPCRRRAYICSPLSDATEDGMLANIKAAKAYMYYANTQLKMVARAPHAYLPFLLCDDIPAERAIALQFGLKLLEQSDVLLVCGNRISKGMEGEIAKAAALKVPIYVFDADTYVQVKKLVTRNGADKKLVEIRCDNWPMGSPQPTSYAGEAVI